MLRAVSETFGVKRRSISVFYSVTKRFRIHRRVILFLGRVTIRGIKGHRVPMLRLNPFGDLLEIPTEPVKRLLAGVARELMGYLRDQAHPSCMPIREQVFKRADFLLI